MSSWIPEAIVSELDNPESRLELARQATAAARVAAPGVDIEMLWDGIWIRRVGPHYFPEPDLFRVVQPKWPQWPNTERAFLRDANDYWFHVYKPRLGDVIVDIGAGRGEDVFAFSRAVGPEGKVFAIEPHPATFQVLGKFCEWNRLANVTTVNCACVDEAASLQIETLRVWQSNYVRTGEPSPTSFPVKGVRFDDLCDEYGIDRIDFLKMNIEGAERTALAGCRRALERTRFVSIAAHDFRAARGEGEHFRTLDFVRQLLTESGFQVTTRDEDPRRYVRYHVHGWRPGNTAP
jgi:FkbM family methyltransferase